MSRFFIDRPIFSWVLAIFIMFAGILAIKTLPISQYPEIGAPKINITTAYIGANAKTVEDTVTQVIEQRISGLDGFRYMEASSSGSGTVSITVTFEQGTDVDIAQVQVQNKVQQAITLLPAEVQQQGVKVEKSSASFLMVVGFFSEDGSQNRDDLGDYVAMNVLDSITRLEGVGQAQLFGSAYAMRIWLDPNKLNNYKMTPVDIARAIKEQNAQVAFGQLGAGPAVEDQALNVTVTSQSKLSTIEQFGNIQLRVNPDGSQVLLKDVATIELGGNDYSTLAYYNGKPSTGIAINLSSGANALDVSANVKSTIAELSKRFPAGMKYVYVFDTIPFVELSIHNVVSTLIEAVALVFIVMFLFLQNFRATLIPTLAIPVVLLGTCGVLAAFGFTLNTLTLFAMVLAIGLLVDDAIVVVENVERIMEEEGLSPVDATRKSMQQITGALIGIALVLSAVFVPMAFSSGAAGVIYRQFSITIVTAMSLSVFVAIFFTPALCATLLKPHSEEKTKFTGVFAILNPIIDGIDRFLTGFNKGFNRINKNYSGGVKKVITKPKRYFMIFLVIFGGLIYGFSLLKPSFLPNEDQGIIFSLFTTPNGTPLNQTIKPILALSEHLLTAESDNIESVFSVGGFSFSGGGGNSGMSFIKLKDWDLRKKPDQSIVEIKNRMQGFLFSLKSAFAFAIIPPPILELGTASGFTLQLQDRGNLGHERLLGAVGEFLAKGAADKRLSQLQPYGQFDGTQYQLNIDQEKARAFGLSMTDVNQTLAIAWGGSYVNDFLNQGKIKRVMLQGQADSRMLPEDIQKWYVRNATGEMVPFSAFSSGEWVQGSAKLDRFDGYSSFKISGSAAPGLSSGVAMAAAEEIVATLPAGIVAQWSDLSFEERQAGNTTTMLYLISLMVVFLSLAALYESWSIPFAVILVVPLGVIGAVASGFFSGMDNDVYFRVALLTTIGLTAKNAILIVEFAKDLMAEGKSAGEAAMEAAHLRLRPIVMTSLAFMLGVLPLALSSGAGSGAQNVVGNIVIGGMVGGTLLTIFYAPLFYASVIKLFGVKVKDNHPEHNVHLD